jgi:hypothetical protein
MLLFLDHEISRRVAVVHVAGMVYLAGVEKNPLSRRGLACVDMGYNAYIAHVG